MATASDRGLTEWSVPTFHPAFIMRDRKKFEGAVVKIDMERAWKLARREWHPRWDRSRYVTGPSFKTAKRVLKAMARPGRRVNFDIETDGGHPYLCDVRCIAFYDGATAICVPFLYRDGTWTEHQHGPWEKDNFGGHECSNVNCTFGESCVREGCDHSRDATGALPCEFVPNGKRTKGNVYFWFSVRYNGKVKQPICFKCRGKAWPKPASRGWQKQMNWFPWWKPEQEDELYEYMQRIFDVCALETQNGQFDRLCLELRTETARATIPKLREKSRRLKRPFTIPDANKPGNFDSILAHHIVTSYFPHNLNFIAGTETEVPYYKTTEEGDAWSASSDYELWDYACDDVHAQYIACTTLREDVKKRAEDIALYDHDSWYESQGQRWKRVGFRVDWRAVELFRKEYGDKQDRALAKMREVLERELLKGDKAKEKDEKLTELLAILNEKLAAKAKGKGYGKNDHDEGDYEEADADEAAAIFNPASLAQLRLLLRHLGVPLTKQTATGELSTKKDFLLTARKELISQGARANKAALAFLDYLFAWRECAKMKSTYLYPDLIKHGPNDYRVHGTFNFHVVPTGRLSGSSPNLTNFPMEVRGMFIGLDSHWLVTGDWSAVEMRLNGLVTDDQAMIQMFKDFDAGKGLKPHIVNASIIFGLPATKDFEDKFPGQYRAAKVFAYLLGYGGGAKACYEKMLDEMPDLKWKPFLEAFNRYRSAYKTFFQNQRDTVLLGTKQHYLDAPVSGRRMYFWEDVRGGWGSGDVVSSESESMQNFRFQCLRGTERVLTSLGMVPISALPPSGFKAWTGQRWASAKMVRKPPRELYRVTTDRGILLDVDSSHQFLVDDKDTHRWVSTLKVDGQRIALSLARPSSFEQPTNRSTEDAWVAGYYGGDGWCSNSRGTVTLVVGDTSGRAAQPHRAAPTLKRLRIWIEEHGWRPSVSKEQGCTRISIAAKRAGEEAVQLLGVTRTEKAHTKRIPEWIWSAPLAHRKEYLRGFLDADGTVVRKQSRVRISCCQPHLLRELWLLARTVGIDGRIFGPYVADRKGHQAWVLLLNGSLCWNELRWGRPGKLRGGESVPCWVAREAFSGVRHSDLQRQSSAATLLYRVRSGGTLLGKTIENLGLEHPELYDYATVINVESLGVREPVFTLMVDDAQHRYDASGVICKNSGTADIVGRANRRMVERVLTPMRAKGEVVEQHAQVHDELLFGVPAQRCEWFKPLFKSICEEPVREGWNLPVDVKILKPLKEHAPSRWKPCYISCKACGRLATAEYAADGLRNDLTVWEVTCEKNEKCKLYKKTYRHEVLHAEPETLN